MTRWVAFIDLVGTRQRAVLAESRLEDALKLFQLEVTRLAESLPSGNECYILSDSAFLEVSDLDALLRGLQRLRTALFDQTVYFKCAIDRGTLGVIRIAEGRRTRKVSGFSFHSAAAIQTYAHHERFHGIGVYIDPASCKDLPKHTQALLVPADYVASRETQSRTVLLQTYYDLRYPLENVGTPLPAGADEGGDNSNLGDDLPRQGERFIDLVLQEMFKARLISLRVASSYVAQLIAMTTSSDFTKLGYEQNFTGYPPIFKALFIEGGLKRCADIPGVAAIQLNLLRQVLRSHPTRPPWINRIIGKTLSQRSVEASLRSMAAAMFSHDERDYILARWAVIATRAQLRRRQSAAESGEVSAS